MMKTLLCLWMKRMNSANPRRNLLLSLFAIAACVLVLAAPLRALAQKNAPRERIVEGKVVNKDGVPIGGAVVYLKNSHSNGVKTYIADEDGHFRFGELSQDTDYELWAESNAVRSKSRQISSFDNENKFYFVLKVSVAKPAASLDAPSVSTTGLPPQP
jgi:DNA/RNA endonuclease YhcR with UshA esterase domain